jgi:hypothetical protein
MIKLVEVCKKHFSLEEGFYLREIVVNPEHVVFLREDNDTKEEFRRIKNRSEERTNGLHAKSSFTKIVINKGSMGVEMTVMGTVSEIHGKVNNSRKLLKG